MIRRDRARRQGRPATLQSAALQSAALQSAALVMILSLGLGLGLAAGPGCGSPCFDDPMEVTVTADVQQGPAPLTVTLTANATERVCGCCDGDDTDIISYGWDLDDDGTLDQVGESLHQVEHTYDATGTYTARVIVTDAGERTAEDTVTITVQ